MRTLFEEILASLRAVGRSPESATRVIGLMLLGVLLNIGALELVDSLRAETHTPKRLSPVSDVARMDIGIVRVAVVRVLEKIGEHKRLHLT
jgi:hypothetical protein